MVDVQLRAKQKEKKNVQLSTQRKKRKMMYKAEHLIHPTCTRDKTQNKTKQKTVILFSLCDTLFVVKKGEREREKIYISYI